MRCLRTATGLLCLIITLPVFSAFAEETESPSVPVAVDAWVDSRIGLRDYHYETDLAPGVHQSDAFVRYAGVGFTARPSEHVEAHFILLFEEFFADSAGDAINMDEGWIKLSASGLYIMAGKLYPAFALEDTWGIEDPMTWYFADHRKSAVEVGYENDYIAISGAFFNGDFDLTYSDGTPKDERIDDYVVHLHVSPWGTTGAHHLEIGACYLSDFTETGLDMGNNYFLSPVYTSPVGAWQGHLDYEGPLAGDVNLGLKASYIQTGEFSKKNYVDADGDKTGVSLVNVEAALLGGGKWWVGAHFSEIMGLDWLLASALDPALTPTRFQRWGTFAGVRVTENAQVAAQTMYGEDDEGDSLLETYFQLLVEF